MIFSSLVFLYAFLPICLLCCALCRGIKAKNACLLIFSLIFYTWGEPIYVLLLAAMAFFDWFFALKLYNTDKENTRLRKTWVALACVVNLGLIVCFKYSKMLCATIGFVPELITRISLPLGISFYTFQLLSYVIDVYRGDAEAQKEYWHVLLFAALYHQCIAGPIVRYKLIAHELFVERDGTAEPARGCLRFCIGLAKKVLIANACGALADSLILSETALSDPALIATNISALANNTVVGTWLGLVAATFQMYFDFSAYSDMAIGLGLMVGLHYPENFDYPYASKSANEYWRRWHITLGQWFRDYLYYPLTLGPGLKIRKKLAKKVGRKTAAFFQNLFTMVIVWTCTGLWHGASWSYALWGLYWCFFMLLEQSFLEDRLKKIPEVFSHVYLIILFIFSRVLFRFGSLEYSLAVLKSMFAVNGNAFIDFSAKTLLINNVFLLLFCTVACIPLLKRFFLWIKSRLELTDGGAKLASVIEMAVIPIVLLVLSTAALVGASYDPFLYFRF